MGRLHAQHPGFARTNLDLIRYDNWTSFGAGQSGFSIEAAFARERFRVDLYISNMGTERSSAAFNSLHGGREAVEEELGMALEWERLPRTFRVAAYRDGGIDSSEAVLEAHKRWAVDLLPRFRDAFQPRIAALDLDALAAEAFEYEEDDA